MELQIRLPSITAKDPDGQLKQVNSYLYQLAGQLQYAMGVVDGSAEAAAEQAEKAMQKAAANDPATNPQATFNAIKSLIIKSADIVEAYSEKIAVQLEGRYVAQSEYGEFVEETSSQLSATANGLTQQYSDIQKINGSLDGIQSQFLETNAYIHTGKIGEDEEGLPIYGVEIGQTSSVDGSLRYDRSLRITSGKLSFFDNNGNEVAYMSDRKMYITDAVATSMQSETMRTSRIYIGNYTIQAGYDGHLTIM